MCATARLGPFLSKYYRLQPLCSGGAETPIILQQIVVCMHSEQAALDGYLTWHHCGTNSMRCIDVERDWRAKLREAPAPPLRKGEFTLHLADERCSSVAGASGACPLSVGGHDRVLGSCWRGDGEEWRSKRRKRTVKSVEITLLR